MQANYIEKIRKQQVALQLKVEQDWLSSINAPVKRLPNVVSESVVIRFLPDKLPREFSQALIEQVELDRMIKDVLEGGDE